MERFAEKFAYVRTSWLSIIGLGLFNGGWLVAHWTLGLDPDLTIGNYVLSIEACMSMPLLYMGIEVAANRDRAKLDEVLMATRALLVQLGSVAEDVEDIEEKL